MADSRSSIHGVSHIGISVSNIERAKTYYGKGLGFVGGACLALNNSNRELLGIPAGQDLIGKTQFMQLNGFVIELIELESPPFNQRSEVKKFQDSGFTHLSLRVSGVDELASSLEDLGGTTLKESRTKMADQGLSGELVFCLDPDGNRIELMDFPSEVQFA